MDAYSHPALTLVYNIGRVAYCDAAWDCGSIYERASDEGYSIPNLREGQRMIIAQVPACNPVTRCSNNLGLAHKTRFVLAHLITDCSWDGVDDASSNFVESKPPLVEYSILRIMPTEDETALRRVLVWECDTTIPIETTNAGVIASNIMGTPIGGAGDFVVSNRNLTFVSFETDQSAKQRAEVCRMVHENLLRNEGEATPVAEGDSEADDVGDTHVSPATYVTPIIQSTRLPPGANLPRDSNDMAWGASGGETDEQTLIMHELISLMQTMLQI